MLPCGRRARREARGEGCGAELPYRSIPPHRGSPRTPPRSSPPAPRTLPLAVPPLTPMRKGSPPLGCPCSSSLCSLSPAILPCSQQQQRRRLASSAFALRAGLDLSDESRAFLPAWFTSPALRLPARCLLQLHMLRPSLPAGCATQNGAERHGTARHGGHMGQRLAAAFPRPGTKAMRPPGAPALAPSLRRLGLPLCPMSPAAHSPSASSERWDHTKVVPTKVVPSRTPVVCPPTRALVL